MHLVKQKPYAVLPFYVVHLTAPPATNKQLNCWHVVWRLLDARLVRLPGEKREAESQDRKKTFIGGLGRILHIRIINLNHQDSMVMERFTG